MRAVGFFATGFLVLSLNAFSLGAIAADENPAIAATNQSDQTESDHKWTYDVYLHGMGAQSGLGIGAETPLFFNFLGLRAIYSFDRLANSGVSGSSDQTVAFSDIQAGIKIQLNHWSPADIYTAVMVNLNFYQPTNGKLQGNLFGEEVCYQIEWRFRGYDGWTDNHEHRFAAFIEMGESNADVRTANAYGAAQIGNGFISRIGFRRFF